MSESNLSNVRVRDRFVGGAPVDGNPGSGDGTPAGPPLAHAASHEDGGSDEIDVTGLSGLLADPQTPLSHTHPLSELEQSGATLGQVATWNGSEWVPDDAVTVDNSWVPLVDGAEPPGLISDGAGHLVFVAFAP